MASNTNRYLLAILIAIATWSYLVFVNTLYNLAPVLLVSKRRRSPDSTIFKKYSSEITLKPKYLDTSYNYNLFFGWFLCLSNTIFKHPTHILASTGSLA